MAYWKQLQINLHESVEAALGDLAPARFRYSTASVGFAYNRRVTTRRGVEMCWNPKEFKGPAPVAASDPELCVLEIQRKEQTYALFNLAGHPVVLGKESNRVSAD